MSNKPHIPHDFTHKSTAFESTTSITFWRRENYRVSSVNLLVVQPLAHVTAPTEVSQ